MPGLQVLLPLMALMEGLASVLEGFFEILFLLFDQSFWILLA